MTKSERNDIRCRVKHIHRLQERKKKLNGERHEIDNELSITFQERTDCEYKLKSDMGDKTTMIIKMEGKYYTLTQNSAGVDIDELIVDIDD